jgi:hypothetical protein
VVQCRRDLGGTPRKGVLQQDRRTLTNATPFQGVPPNPVDGHFHWRLL